MRRTGENPIDSYFHHRILSRDEATLFKGMSVRRMHGPSAGFSVGWMDGPLLTSYFFGLVILHLRSTVNSVRRPSGRRESVTMANQDTEITNEMMKKRPSHRVHIKVDENLNPKEKEDLEDLFNHIQAGETKKAQDILNDTVS